MSGKLVRAVAVGGLTAIALATAPSVERAEAMQPNGRASVCADAGPGTARCFASVATIDGRVMANASAPIGGYGPADLQSAYALTSAAASVGSTQTVAVVDAYDDPKAESDLAVYRAKFGLPACTTANRCFRKVNQTGGAALPVPDLGWAEEISLDLDMVSAICPKCHILLVEASSASMNALAQSVRTAATLGANAISNSYGTSSEFSGETNYDQYYNIAGVAVTASSGDSGYGVSYPAASRSVVSVGGTTLTKPNGAWSERAWSGAGSGCSAYETKPTGQPTTSCARRTVSDVAAVADPYTGVAVYDSYRVTGWMVFGGTSVSSPIIASVYALAGNTRLITPTSYLYAHPQALRDVTSGSNGSCSGSLLCTAKAGYDGPTGLGTPQGTGAF